MRRRRTEITFEERLHRAGGVRFRRAFTAWYFLLLTFVVIVVAAIGWLLWELSRDPLFF